MTKREARLIARHYVVRLLRERESEIGDDLFNQLGDDITLVDAASDEMHRIADRIERMLPSGLSADAPKNPQEPSR